MKRFNILLAILLILTLAFTACTNETTDETQVEDSESQVEEVTTDDDAEVKSDNMQSETEEVEEVVTYVAQPVPDSVKELTVAYALFPIAYADADGNGNGDLQGVLGSLDYLKDELNVDVIWLNPVHPSPSYHKYDVVDYYEIDPAFGTLEDYKQLLDEAHKRDIKVLLDFVINHTSSQNPWFLGAKANPESEYRDYYSWDTLEETEIINTSSWYSVSGQDEKYYAGFWSEMPELRLENPEVRQLIKDMAKYWLDFGVDGFRIDAASHMYDLNEYPKGTPVMTENYEWFVEFNQYIKEVNPEAFLLLEAWEDSSTVSGFLEGADASFNFDLSSSILSAVNSENRKELQGRIDKIHKKYDKVTENYIDAVFLTNHDQDRLLSQLGGNEDKAKLAAAINFTLPGLSWIYYGEELGMTGTGDHENIREGFKWTMDQSEIPNSAWRTWNHSADVESLDIQMTDEMSMFNHYKTLTSLKSNDMVLSSGDYIDYEIGSSFRIFAFFRQYEGETYLVMHNLHDEQHNFTLSESIEGTVFSTKGSIANDTSVILEPYGSLVMKVSSESVTAEELK